jgi:hypothetical protein
VSDASEVSESIEDSLGFMLWHFEGQHSLFPRNISTGATNGGQKTVYDRDRAILFIQGALRQDCYLSVYPNYEEIIKNGSITPDYLPKPDHIFIDLDLKQFGNDINKLNQGLKVTLKNIHQLLNGAVPTVVETGGGCHVHQPLDANALPVFEHMPEFKRFKELTTEFMRYAERRLTNYKSDPSHKMAWKSCLTRIPNTINTKYPAKVTIVQKWNGVRAIPTKQFMLTDFLVYLIEKNFDFSAKAGQKKPIHRFDLASNNNNGYVGWIERLLDTSLDDYRKRSRDLIIVPYLMVRRGMTDINEIEARVMKWADKCGELYPLEPSRDEYAKRIRYRVKKVMRDMIPPMSFDTLKEENPALAQRLIVEVGK